MLIQVKALTFKYATQTVLDRISLEVPENAIYGLLGLNGSGKTTLIKILLGLIKVDQGKVHIFGNDIRRERLKILQNIGCFVEGPSLYPNMSVFDYLKIKQILLNLPKSSIDRALEIVSLQQARTKKIKTLSLGMKQRLCIAFALLNDPQLIILDEPANGLDPSGIKDIRMLLKDLNQQFQKTIFISSHILDEVEKTATHVGVLNQGQVIFEDTIQRMSAKLGRVLRVGVHHQDKSMQILEAANYKSTLNSEGLIEVKIDSIHHIIEINQLLAEAKVGVYYLNGKDKQLEDLFFELTS